MNITNFPKFGKFIENTKPDVIIHLAGNTSHSLSFEKPLQDVDLNTKTTNTIALLPGSRKSEILSMGDLMIKLASDYPQYGWLKNKGYGTKQHILAIKNYGVTKYHRVSFLKNLSFG